MMASCRINPISFILASIVMTLIVCVNSLDNGVARTPPMGWMHWERFRCNLNCTADPDNCISEKLFKQTADAMVSGGFKDAGYQYVSIDDCWMLPERGPDGRLQADPERFPSGMKALADYIHSKGLKFGMYADMGLHTCKLYPGSKFYLQLDAETFASWEVDMLKLDCCWAGGLEDLETGYQVMGFFLNRTQRPIMYSCSWPACSGSQTKYNLVAKHCNTWRNYADLRDDFHYVYAAIDYYGNNTGHFQEVAGPGQWNDPDQLVVGDFGLSADQERAQFGMWCMMASPLIMSVDVRNIRSSAQQLLLNPHLISINQDPLGVQGFRVFKRDGLELWKKPLGRPSFVADSWAVAVLNYNNYGYPLPFESSLMAMGLNISSGYNLIDAFSLSDMGKYLPSNTVRFKVNPTGVFIFTAEPIM